VRKPELTQLGAEPLSPKAANLILIPETISNPETVYALDTEFIQNLNARI
jgi:hypothetical protein